MNESLFNAAIHRRNMGRPPVWFMRQAGRYHAHYQALRKQHGFIELCKNPELACEVTMGPIRDFDFDAAILFSDILFPLEVMGMGLAYDPAPELGWLLDSLEQCQRLKRGEARAAELSFQSEALGFIRDALPADKGLLGFVGAPFTLFCYAVEGSHKGGLKESISALSDGRADVFFEVLLPILTRNMIDQAKAGADAMALFDTCAGELTPAQYEQHIVPVLRTLLDRVASEVPDVPIVYYSRGTGPDHWRCLTELPISCLGIDWNHDLPEVLKVWGDRWAIQGNFPPADMTLPGDQLEPLLDQYFSSISALPEANRRGWICGLGHGVVPQVPEANVRLFLEKQKRVFG